MLSLTTRERLLRDFPTIYWVDAPFDPATGLTQWGMRPEKRWAYEDYDAPSPPYEQLAFRLDPIAVAEGAQPTGGLIERDISLPATADADSADRHGQLMYDVLNIRVTTEGNNSRRGLTLTPNQRAYALTAAVYKFLTTAFRRHPLDEFEPDGTLRQPYDAYADDLEPPLQVRRIPGRGPTDVTEQVEAAGAQFDCAVELHYVSTWLEAYYTATDFDGSTEFQFPDGSTTTDPITTQASEPLVK